MKNDWLLKKRAEKEDQEVSFRVFCVIKGLSNIT